MQIVMIIGAIWISLLVVGLWINYRFHRSYTVNEDQELIIESSSAPETMMSGARS